MNDRMSDMDARELAVCLGCGAEQDYEVDTLPTPSSCHECPPRICADCGQMDHIDNLCACWVAVDTLAHADLKALLAASDLSIGAPK